MNVTLYYQDDRSDKVYHLQVEPSGAQYVVNFQFGRRGSTLQTGTKTPLPVPLADAEKIANRILREKLGKGYQQAANGKAVPLAPPSAAERTAYPAELLEEISEQELARLIASDAYLLQEKRDGHRRQIVRRGGQLTGYNRKGTVVATPEALARELLALPSAHFHLDGEAEGDRFVAFDLLESESLNVTADQPYRTRYQRLSRLLESTKLATVVRTWGGRSSSANQSAKAQAVIDLQTARAEGLVLKLASAPYRGGRNGQHYKFKFVKTCTVKVLRVGDKGKQSVALGLLENGQWVDVGTVSTIGKPQTAAGEIIEVRYLYATASRRLYQATYLRKRRDQDETDCGIGQLRYKQGVPEAA